MAIIPYSLLIIGVTPIPLSANITASILTDVSNSISLNYEKYNLEKDIIAYSIRGESTYTLVFHQVTDSDAARLMSFLKTILEIVANFKEEIFEFNPTLKEKIALNIKSSATKCSFFDSLGYFSFFQYRITGIDFNTNIDGGVTNISLNFSNGANDENINSVIDVKPFNNVKLGSPVA